MISAPLWLKKVYKLNKRGLLQVAMGYMSPNVIMIDVRTYEIHTGWKEHRTYRGVTMTADVAEQVARAMLEAVAEARRREPTTRTVASDAG